MSEKVAVRGWSVVLVLGLGAAIGCGGSRAGGTGGTGGGGTGGTTGSGGRGGTAGSASGSAGTGGGGASGSAGVAGGGGSAGATGGVSGSGGGGASGSGGAGAGGTVGAGGASGRGGAGGASGSGGGTSGSGGAAGTGTGGGAGGGGASGSSGGGSGGGASGGSGGGGGSGGAGVATLVLQGCTTVAGARPASTGTTAAPQAGNLQIGLATAGQPITGTFTFNDAQGDADTLIVQVSGMGGYLTCTLTASDISSKQIDLGKLTVQSGTAPGTYVIYFAVRDAAGNVSGYVTGTLTVGTPTTVPVCTTGAASAFQVVGQVPSASTSFYLQQNGASAEYLLGGATGQQLTIVRRTRLAVDPGSCTHLYLAGDAAGTTPIGWDNCLLIEYRATPGGPVGKNWYYCSADTTSIYYVPAGATQTIVRGPNPTVAGTSLTPPVPSSGPFGYPAMGIDLVSQIPSGATTFELTFYVFDWGTVGSTTDVWLIPR